LCQHPAHAATQAGCKEPSRTRVATRILLLTRLHSCLDVALRACRPGRHNLKTLGSDGFLYLEPRPNGIIECVERDS
jgi:hypothetical protein